MAAEQVADQLAAVINASALGRSAPCSTVGGIMQAVAAGAARVYSALYRSLCPAAGRRVAAVEGAQQAVWQPRAPPNWFFAGGSARTFVLLGVAQKLLPAGWPANSILAKKFGVAAPLPAP